MDAESGPIRCDSSLSVVKIQPVIDGQKGKRLLARHKFSDPEIEGLYQLHSANQKRTELFRCFLYSILFYSIVHIIVYAAWIGRNPVVFGGSDNHERFHHHESSEIHGIPTTIYSDAETPETMTLNTYASMLETSNSRLQKSVFHVDETSDILQYSVVKNHGETNQYPLGSTTANIAKKEMSLEANSHFTEVPPQPKLQREGTTTSKVMMKNLPLPLPAPPSKPSHNLYDSINTNDNKDLDKKGRSSATPIIASATSATTEESKRVNAIHFLPPPRQTFQQPSITILADKEHLAWDHPDKQQKQAGHFKESGKSKDLNDIDDDEDVAAEDENENNQDQTTIAQNDKPSKCTIRLSRHFNEFIEGSSDSSGNIQSDDARSHAWFPFAAKTNFHFRGKRDIQTRGVHRFSNMENNNNQNHLKVYDAQQSKHKLESVFTSILANSTVSTEKSGGGENRESRYNKVNFKAYAYTHSESSPGNMYFVLVLLCLLTACVFIVSFMLLPFKRCPRNHHIPVIIWSATILCSVACNVESSVHPRLALGWILLEIFLIWITLPLRMRTALFYSTILAMLYIIVTSVRERNRPYLGRQIGADIILIVITNILGMLGFYLSDKKQRRAFIDTRQSLEMKLVIEEQAKEQERLLLSVLPEHLALKMRQDLGEATDGQQFKKIYMSRHENVSILYADIVGFTAISSTYSASELVKILNELFATFDKLAEKYNQIRIKILGDCYYCICGAPEERDDHGILSVHMGLSMVKAIKYVREKTKSSVDMRVGIHTGAILAGVMGQRQWQFDIYSKDVELANKMESSGKPGRVHISEVTLSYLNDGFEVEPAYGEKREEILRIAGIKTYFIVRPIKPFRESSTGATENGDVPDDTVITKDFPSDLHSTFAEDSNSAIDESHVHGKQTEIEAYRLRLKDELLSRDGYKDLSRQSKWLTLSFRDSSQESEFTKHKDPYAGIYYGACPIALVAVALSAFSVISFTIVGLVVLLVGLFFLALITTFSACETSPMKSRLKKMSGIIESFCSLESELWVRRLVSVLGALVLTAANVAFMIPCLETKECSTTDEVEEPLVLPQIRASKMSGHHDDCRLPAFFFPFAAVILFSITLLTYLGFWLKSLIIVAILLLHTILMLVTPLKSEMECSERLLDNDEYRLIPVYCYLSLFAAVAFGGLFSLNRRLEKSARVLFLWKVEVEHQGETATQLRQKNESLLLELPKFNEHIIKIKTISSTYMAASGLSPSKQARMEDPVKTRWNHLSLLVEFAFELKRSLTLINEQSFNHFVLKMGINHGPITAGVIGARKPHYDIWGNSVNVASRMESTGKAGYIQVTAETMRILRLYGYQFEQRGLVNVKGKGQLMTYYLIGRGPEPSQEEVEKMLSEPETDGNTVTQ